MLPRTAELEDATKRYMLVYYTRRFTKLMSDEHFGSACRLVDEYAEEMARFRVNGSPPEHIGIPDAIAEQLADCGIMTVQAICNHTREQLYDLPDVGPKTVDVIAKKLELVKMALRVDVA